MTDNIREQVKTLILSGKSLDEVASLTLIKKNSLRYHFNKLEKPFSKIKRGRTDILDFYKEGFSCKEIMQKLDLKYHVVQGYLSRNNLYVKPEIHHNKKYFYNSTVFSIIDNEEKAYWLGFLYADGYVDENKNVVSLNLAKKDIVQLDRFSKFINYTKSYYYFSQKSPSSENIGEYVRMFLTDKQITKDLVRNGCIQAKTFKITFPDETILPKELQHHFIRGYFDGDGSIFISNEKHWRSGKIVPTIHCKILGTKHLIEGILNVSNTGNEKCIKSRGKMMEYWVKRNPRVLAFYEYMYKDATIYMERKKVIFDNYFKKDVQRL